MGRANWSEAQDLTPLKVLIEDPRSGKRADSGFKKPTWEKAKNAVNTAHGVKYEVTQMKSRCACVGLILTLS
jgi:hypothetical protein